MTKKIWVIGRILAIMLLFITISPNFTDSVKADVVSSDVEQMLNEAIEEYGIENVIFEDGIILNVNEEINLEEIAKLQTSELTDILWSVRDGSIATVNENLTLTGLQEGTTFLVGQVGNKYHIRELYISNPELVVQQYSSRGDMRKSQYVVYLDPGHGGSDPGAIGNGIIEKDIVLNIALDVKRQLENVGVKVVMSRESDVYVALKERSSGANAVSADIFVSIHMNSATATSAYGIETYYMKSQDYKLAENMQRRLMQYISTIDRGVKYADFHVLRETAMASALIECGFISNPGEANKLKQPSTQKNLAEAITNGAFDYLKANVTLTPLNGERIYGSERYETSYKIFEKGWETSDTAILVSGLDYPDALTSAPLASKYNAPILLSKNNSLNSQPNLKEILVNKGVKNVFIVGGTSVIPSSMDNELTSMGISVKRLAGIDRYETAVAVANEVGVTSGEVSLVNGLSFADGLSISAIAAKNRSPILLTRTNEIPNVTKTFLNDNSITKTYVIGASGVVSDNLLGQLKNPERLGGLDRYITNKLILDRFKSELDLSEIYIASAFTFPDALSASALAGKNNNFVLLSNTFNVDSTVKSEISENKNSIEKAYILGGPAVISDEIIRGLGIGI